MLPLVSAGLSRVPKSARHVPEAVSADLEQWRPLHISHTLSLVSALLELQQEFDRQQLHIVSWKGPVLAVLLYGTPSLREASDLDFLLTADDLPQILLIAEQFGYTLLGQNGSAAHNRYTFAHQHEFSFFRSRDNIVLEFHVQIMTARFSFWQNSQAHLTRAVKTTAPLAGQKFLIEQPEDLIVGLCIHAFKHNWDRMKWVADIARFLQVYGPQLDWARFIATLKQGGQQTVVLLGLSLAGTVFDLQLPAPIVSPLQRSPRVALLAGEIAAHIMSGSTELLPARYRQQLLVILCPRLQDRIVYRLRPLLHLEYEDLFISEQNHMFYFLNYLYRIIRLLRKHGSPRVLSRKAAPVRAARS